MPIGPPAICIHLDSLCFKLTVSAFLPALLLFGTGIRLAPSIANVLKRRGELPSRAMAFAVAAMLRFLTPLGPQPSAAGGVFKGRMDPVDRLVPPGKDGRSLPARCCVGQVLLC